MLAWKPEPRPSPSYYLRHLCDETRFPDWPVSDHVPFLQARERGSAPAAFCKPQCTAGASCSLRRTGLCDPIPCPAMRYDAQALLEEWRAELARKPLGMSEADACKASRACADADSRAVGRGLSGRRLPSAGRVWLCWAVLCCARSTYRTWCTPIPQPHPRCWACHPGPMARWQRRT